ncbi:MAG: N-formylglutamate amidohydrolase [Acidimicrobiia bacterium]|nr:N-formylglutamate amidohydrolase [Acidimicrobiia bacterium]
MTGAPWMLTVGDDPIVATAIHSGHELRPEVGALMKLSTADRLREEDPFTGLWTDVAKNTITVARSRFEVDLNRPRDKAVYLRPEDAWGLEIWRTQPPDDVVAESLQLYDDFYADLQNLCDQLVDNHGRFVLLDLHSYNHRRAGPAAAVEDPAANPDINLGTESIDGDVWGDVIQTFANAMATAHFDDDHLDVRENIRFKGGQMTRWVNQRYAARGCSIAVEVKKLFMDEWTGQRYEDVTLEIGEIIRVATVAVREALTG